MSKGDNLMFEYLLLIRNSTLDICHSIIYFVIDLSFVIGNLSFKICIYKAELVYSLNI